MPRGAPPLSLLRQHDTHRLIPSRHLPRDASVLAPLADDDEELRAVMDLDGVTNDRLIAHGQRLPGIGLEELVFGVPHADVVNASFCHAHPLGARFSGPDRGAWYAAFDVATSQAEVGFHKSVHLAEIGRFEDSVTYDDYLADFSASFHDLRRARGFGATVINVSAAQQFENRVNDAVAQGAKLLVGNVRRGKTYRFTWKGTPQPTVSVER